MAKTKKAPPSPMGTEKPSSPTPAIVVAVITGVTAVVVALIAHWSAAPNVEPMTQSSSSASVNSPAPKSEVQIIGIETKSMSAGESSIAKSVGNRIIIQGSATDEYSHAPLYALGFSGTDRSRPEVVSEAAQWLGANNWQIEVEGPSQEGVSLQWVIVSAAIASGHGMEHANCSYVARYPPNIQMKIVRDHLKEWVQGGSLDRYSCVVVRSLVDKPAV